MSSTDKYLKRLEMDRLEYVNNWEADEYYVKWLKPWRSVERLKRVMIDGEEYDVITRRVVVEYNDMGHTYDAISNHFFIVKEVFGIKQEFDLNKIVPNKAVYIVA